MTHLERYQRLSDLIQDTPQFASPADGLNVCYETMQEHEYRRFVVYGRMGLYEFHRCYWQRGVLVSTVDHTTYESELWRLRRLAAQELGNSLLNQ